MSPMHMDWYEIITTAYIYARLYNGAFTQKAQE